MIGKHLFYHTYQPYCELTLMDKQPIRFYQGIIFILAGFAGWYVIATGNYFLLEWLASGPFGLYVFVIGVLLFPLTPILILGGVIFLFTLSPQSGRYARPSPPRLRG